MSVFFEITPILPFFTFLSSFRQGLLKLSVATIGKFAKIGCPVFSKLTMDSTDTSAEFEGGPASRYEAIANEPRYRHFVRIPGRIVRCLAYFRVPCDQILVERRLRAYYLFIGVIDQAIDSGKGNVSELVLQRISSGQHYPGESANTSEIILATDQLKREIPDEISSEVIKQLTALSETVEKERSATSMSEYIEVRKRVGQLTARISHLLIRSLVSPERSDVCQFMERVGEIGCLVDSVIDIREDGRRGLLNFRRTPLDFVRLLGCTMTIGARLSIAYPRLSGLFLESIADNVLDRFRARAGDKRLQVLSENAAATPT